MCNVYLICYYLIFSVHFVWKKKSKFFNAISMLSVFVFGVAFLQISRLCSYFYVLTTFPLYCYLELFGKIQKKNSKMVYTMQVFFKTPFIYQKYQYNSIHTKQFIDIFSRYHGISVYLYHMSSTKRQQLSVFKKFLSILNLVRPASLQSVRKKMLTNLSGNTSNNIVLYHILY